MCVRLLRNWEEEMCERPLYCWMWQPACDRADEAHTEHDRRGRWKDVAPSAAKLMRPEADPSQDLYIDYS